MNKFHRSNLVFFSSYNYAIINEASEYKSSSYELSQESTKKKKCPKGSKSKKCQRNKKRNSTRRKLGAIGNNKTGLQGTLTGDQFYKVR